MKPYLKQEVPPPIPNAPTDGNQLVVFEKTFSKKAITIYIAALVVCNLIFFNKILAPMFWLSGIVAVYAFFHYCNQLSRKWGQISIKKFEKKLFRTALIIRVIWVLVSYVMYNALTGQPFEWGAGDVMFYHGSGLWIVELFKTGDYHLFVDSVKSGYSDMGYATYLGIVYSLTGNSILAVRILKALYGAIVALLLYRLAKRNFGEGVGRMAGIVAMLMPNLILYCGLHLKEAEMVFLTVLFIERSDAFLREKKIKPSALILPALSAMALFFFRTILGVTVIFSLLITVMMTSNRVMKMGRKMVITLCVLLAATYILGGKILMEVEEVWDKRQDNQNTSMQWRSTRENGNKYAKYIGGAVFAPMIFVIPFPTLVGTPGQENQQLINGGNYVKNVLGFFMLLALIHLVKEKRWRNHLLFIVFIVAYLGVLVMSAFAQSERFHQPVLPFELILAAYGISIVNKSERKWYKNWMNFIFVVILVWSFFKLAGRGLT